MKKIILFLLSLTFIFIACESYESYINVYGEPVHLSDNFNKWIDDPNKLIWDFSPIQIYIPPGNGYVPDIYEYSNSTYFKMEQMNKNLWEALKPHNIQQFTKRLKEEPNYRNWFIFSLMDGTCYIIESYVAFDCIYGYIPKTYSMPYKNTIDDLLITNSVKTKSSNTLANIKILNGKSITLKSGNKRYGLKHCKIRHSPDFYIKSGVHPDKYTSLFLNGSDEYIINLFKQIEGKKINFIETYNNYIAFEVRLECAVGIERWYNVIYKPSNGNVISFYPTQKIQRVYLENKFKNYTLLKYTK